MSRKKNIENYYKEFKLNLEKGRNVKLFVKGYYDEFFEVREYTAYVDRISRERVNKKIMPKLQLIFDNNQVVETIAFIGNDIKVGDFVKVIGYFSTYDNQIKFNCKGGINKILNNAKELPKFNVLKTYEMGLPINLSKVELSPVYRKNDNFIEIEGLEDFYYMVGEEIEKNINTDNDILYEDENEEEEFIACEDIEE